MKKLMVLMLIACIMDTKADTEQVGSDAVPPAQAIDNFRHEYGYGKVVWQLGDEKIGTSVYSAEGTTFNAGKYVMLLCQKEEDSYFRNEVAFKSLEDLEYAIGQVSNFLAKAARWQKIAIEKDIVGMNKNDEKTHIAFDKDGDRVENFTFNTRRMPNGEFKCWIYVTIEKEVPALGRFRNFVMDATVDDYMKHIEKAFGAVNAFKADVVRRKVEAKKRAETADLFN